MGSPISPGRGRRSVLVAVEGAHLTGFAAARPSRDDDNDGTVGEVAALYVAPAHWRRGIGTHLLEEALTRIRHDGSSMATLWVLEGNEPAKRFYEYQAWIPDRAHRVEPDIGALEVRYRRPTDAAQSAADL